MLLLSDGRFYGVGWIFRAVENVGGEDDAGHEETAYKINMPNSFFHILLSIKPRRYERR